MRLGALAVGVCALWLTAAAGQDDAAAQGRTVWDGVYTEAQAERGEAAYMTDCSSCHGADLGGDGFAPALSGGEFSAAWNGLSVGDLVERIRLSMPPTDPESVSLAQKVDIVTFMLRANEFPAGTTELAGDVEALKQITYQANK